MTYSTEQQSQSAPETSGSASEDFFGFGIEGALLVAAIALVGGAHLIIRMMSGAGSNSKNVLGTAQWANGADIRAAGKRAKKQLASRKHDEVALWINTPAKIKGSKVSGDGDTVWFPDAARGLCCIGGSGSGKSYTAVKPMLRSAVSQGFPIVLLDTDYPGLTQMIAPLAESLGYEVSIFAPGYPESKVCNVLDFIKDKRDGTGASQISQTLNKNFSQGSDSGDKFFETSGALATEASLLLAKALKYQDILTAFAILKDENMIERVKGVGKLDPWLELSFGQLLSTAKSEKTVDSIRGTAALLFGQLMRPDILPTLIGETTIPLDVRGKKLLIFGVKQDIRLVVSPLIAAIIHAIVTRNVKPGRKEPLILSLDELPSMFFPEIAEWLSEKRKYGLCCQIGYQSLEQLKKTYGQEMANVIYTNTGTKLLFNPQSFQSAKVFSDTLGEKDVVYKTKGRSYSKTSTRSQSEHRTKVPLFTADQFMGLDSGSCVIISPGYGAKKRKFVPVFKNPVKITKREMAIQSATEDAWNSFLSRAIRGGVGDKRINPDEIGKRVDNFQNTLPIKGDNSGDDFKNMLVDV